MRNDIIILQEQDIMEKETILGALNLILNWENKMKILLAFLLSITCLVSCASFDAETNEFVNLINLLVQNPEKYENTILEKGYIGNDIDQIKSKVLEYLKYFNENNYSIDNVEDFILYEPKPIDKEYPVKNISIKSGNKKLIFIFTKYDKWKLTNIYHDSMPTF